MRITKKDNVVFEGNKYMAIPDADMSTQCRGCYFSDKMVCHLIPCISAERKDGKRVKFILKVKK